MAGRNPWTLVCGSHMEVWPRSPQTLTAGEEGTQRIDISRVPSQSSALQHPLRHAHCHPYGGKNFSPVIKTREITCPRRCDLLTRGVPGPGIIQPRKNCMARNVVGNELVSPVTR
ncbi:hypothetical protein SCLCIDRAFT_1208088 [Scleroderma citrinum Foug A]|uniref:Uncharacterized protein n=1 Tax=Scleroderma citrinum Foug A TaxID=1036808 RepID=A0A0C3AXC5_9AGAM|nr:hypothetical protein SCLCIDRAFT_1208088 [Scleroderma citrinum Foug A]